MTIKRTLKKIYEGERSVQAYLIEGDHFSEVRFFCNGHNQYTVSAQTLPELLEKFEEIENTYFKAFYGTIHKIKNEVDVENEIKRLGFE